MSKLFQHQSLGDLMAGFFDGSIRFGELLDHGDTGLGTFHAFDGEFIMVDGQAYQVRASGQVVEVEPELTSPYAAVTFFEPDRFEEIKRPTTLKKMRSEIGQMVQSKNVFSVIRIDGHFDYVHTRAVPKQEKPYPRLVEATRVQPEFEQYDIMGTAVGIYTPHLYDGVAKGGFHCHFISDDRKFGGHILDYIVTDAKVQIQTIDSLEQHFATDYAEFMENDIDYDNLAAEMEEAEG
ncbi:acetolactate decarboxylase [Aerococcus sanguinicola]|uniref:acetolactate decarboxylase n=1 Tax=Aerococcus sanguinicola TaxID=119206 RepID=UPI00255100C0|nr:acetolactate decarboxylase [Aerococcus sanguinicola]MDK7050686.1 acetolactate decarboxylase [Aerococcus sanguinicola]